jgi:hypothetical protein
MVYLFIYLFIFAFHKVNGHGVTGKKQKKWEHWDYVNVHGETDKNYKKTWKELKIYNIIEVMTT